MLVLRFVELGVWREVLLLKPGREGVEDGFLGRDPGILGVSWFIVVYRAMLGWSLLVSLRVVRAQQRLLQWGIVAIRSGFVLRGRYHAQSCFVRIIGHLMCLDGLKLGGDREKPATGKFASRGHVKFQLRANYHPTMLQGLLSAF